AIAQKAPVLVAGILTRGKLMLLAIAQNLGAAEMQQRTNNISFQSLHPRQARQSAAAQPVHYQRLHLIVSVVSNGNARCANSSCNGAQKRIARLPGSLFKRAMGLPRQGRNICLAQRAGHAPLRGEISHKRRVGLASLSAQPMIEMGNMQVNTWVWTFRGTK